MHWKQIGTPRNICLLSAYTALLLLCLCIHKDYGISFDEPNSRLNGAVTYQYLKEAFYPGEKAESQASEKIPALQDYVDKDYGVAFELPVYFLEKALKLKESQSIYYFRHFCTFIIFAIGSYALFLLISDRFNSWKVGFFALLCLFLSPRFFAESFYNSKDVVFMSFFTISLYTMFRYVRNPRYANAFFHACTTALAMDTRLMAIIIPAATVGVSFFKTIIITKSWKKDFPTCIAYLAFAWIGIVLCWPWLWSAPWENFLTAFANMEKFRWTGSVFYFGRQIPGAALPWHYIPIWILITTPIPYSILFLAGLSSMAVQLVKKYATLWTDENFLYDMACAGIFFGSIASIIVLHSVVYDGWRQMYFLYSPFLLIVTRGAVSILHNKKLFLYKKYLYAAFCLSMLPTLIWMVRAHPYQNVYFNSLVRGTVNTKFDVDYWSLSVTDALRYILAHDARTPIRVHIASQLTPLYTTLLSPKEKTRIEGSVGLDIADYVLTTYRLHQPGPELMKDFALFKDLRAADETVLSIFKRKQPAGAQ